MKKYANIDYFKLRNYVIVLTFVILLIIVASEYFGHNEIATIVTVATSLLAIIVSSVAIAMADHNYVEQNTTVLTATGNRDIKLGIVDNEHLGLHASISIDNWGTYPAHDVKMICEIEINDDRKHSLLESPFRFSNELLAVKNPYLYTLSLYFKYDVFNRANPARIHYLIRMRFFGLGVHEREYYSESEIVGEVLFKLDPPAEPIILGGKEWNHPAKQITVDDSAEGQVVKNDFLTDFVNYSKRDFASEMMKQFF